MAFQKFLWFFVAFFIASISCSTARTFNVGGSHGWTLHPSENYNQWSGRLRFLVNDILHFKYDKASDSVLVVNKGDYDTCNTNNPLTKLDGGDSSFTLDRPGPFYFISGNKTNCDQGQKLIVVVLSPRNRATPPSPSTMPPASSTMPPASSTMPPPASGPSSSTVSPPSLSPGVSPSAMTPPTASSPTSSPPASSPGALTPASSPGGSGALAPASPPGGSGALTPGGGGGGALTPGGGGGGALTPGGGGGALSPGGGGALSPGGSNPADVNAPPPQGSFGSPKLTTSAASLFMIILVFGMLY